MLGLYVEFKAKSSEIDQTFGKMDKSFDKTIRQQKQVESNFNSMHGVIKKLVAAFALFQISKMALQGVKHLGEYLNNVAENIDKMVKTSGGLNIPIDKLQQLQYVARLAGVGTDELQVAFRKMALEIGKGQIGDEGVAHMLKAIGTSVDDLKGKDIGTQFEMIAAGIGNISDTNLRAAVSSQLFGRNFTGVLNMINQNVAETSDEFKKLGITITEGQGRAVEKFNDDKEKLDEIWKGFSAKVVSYLAEPFDNLINYVSDTIVKMGGIDQAAMHFAKAIITGVQFAINGMNSLLNTIDSIYARMLKMQIFALEAANSAGRSIDNSPLNKLIVAIDPNAKKIYNNNEAARTTRTKGLYEELNSTERAMQARTDPLKGAIDLLQKGIDDMILSMGTTLVPFRTAAQTAAELAEAQRLAAKKIEDSLTNFLKNAGQTKIQEVLGGKPAVPEVARVYDDPRIAELETRKIELAAQETARQQGPWDAAIKAIYDKAIMGTGGITTTGTFNGKSMVDRTTTAAEDLNKLKQEVNAAAIGGNIGPISGYIGAIDELTAFLKKMDPNANRVKVDIEVKTEEGFILKIAQSQAMDKQMQKTLLDATALNARSMGGVK